MSLKPLPAEAGVSRVIVVETCGYATTSGVVWGRLDTAALGVGGERVIDDGGTLPRPSADQARHAAEDESQDGLARCAAGQVQLDLGFPLDDAHGELDQAQAQRVELEGAPR